MRPISAASALLLAYLVWGSRGWPLIHDAALMHYVAWLITQGAVPYRDVFDMNLPGVYLLHAAVLHVGGSGDLAWRLFDLAWLAATGALLWAYCRPLSYAAGAGAVLFGLFHLSGGAWRAGQRDFLLCLFLLAGAYGVARGLELPAGRLALFAGGVALGAGMTVKPHAGLFWLLCAAVAAGAAWRAGRSAWRPAALVLAGGLLVPALVFGWLAGRGGLAPFQAVLTGYVLPLYSQVGRTSALGAVRWHAWGRGLLALLAGLGVLGVLGTPRPWSPRLVLASLGALYGAAHFALQGKGWEYQLYPLALFLCALASAALAPDRTRPPAPGRGRVRRRLALVAWAGLVLVLGAKGVEAREPDWIAEKTRRVGAITRDLAPLVPPGATVQVLDTTSGGIHALLRLGLRQPTRFIYDFHFFHHVGDPQIRALRAELVAGLEARRPAAVVVLEESWPELGYGRVATFPELAQLLERSFTLAATGPGYRIHAQRSDS
ncbi:MAG TPA: hypothetical protein VLK35_10115 [Methylomirabilota bacterium]|nr:hypothetical protein [Methylomirabilota bacterium]